MKYKSAPLTRQSGVVLAISLIMLLLLTLIGITGLQTTSLEEKMASNSKNRNLAFQAAESALRHAEQYINSGTADSKATSINIDQGPFNIPVTSQLPGLSAQPQYTIKLVAVDYYTSNPAKYATYQITSTAAGGDSNTLVRLQTVFIAQVTDPISII